MSVAIANAIGIRLWRGYDDPGLPVGMWFAQNSVTGDGSGGGATVIFEFKGEGNPVSGRFFNIERIEAHRSGAVTTAGALQATNFETLGPVGLVNRNWRFGIASNQNGVSAISDLTYLPLPLFLGAAAPVPSLSADVEVSIPNVDLTSFVVTLQGYIWEARSIQSEGGLRRPADSLYGG